MASSGTCVQYALQSKVADTRNMPFIAIALVAALALGGGLSVAAQGAQPGDALYPYKTTVNDNVQAGADATVHGLAHVGSTLESALHVTGDAVQNSASTTDTNANTSANASVNASASIKPSIKGNPEEENEQRDGTQEESNSDTTVHGESEGGVNLDF